MRAPITLRRHRLVTAVGSVKGDPEQVAEAAHGLVEAGYPARVECATITLMPSGTEILDRWTDCKCVWPAPPASESPVAKRLNARCENCDHRRGDHSSDTRSSGCLLRAKNSQGLDALCICASFQEESDGE